MMTERYKKFSAYLKERFGQRVHKVSVDAGFSCPNRDGTISDRGCIYCDNKAFSFHSRSGKPTAIQIQIAEGIKQAKKRFKAQKFFVYFQAYTNTYAPTSTLKERYDLIRRFEDVVGLSIATRPDCINEKILGMVSSYTDDYEVWIEYGLQSVHNKTLAAINRGHRYEDFLKAVELTRRYNIKICAHVILGLPNETKAMMLETAEEMARLKIDGIKLHPLHIIKQTALEEVYRRGEYKPLILDEYIELAAEFLAHLWPQTVIERISAYCPKELLVAPQWVSGRNSVEKQLGEMLVKKDYFQGRFYRG